MYSRIGRPVIGSNKRAPVLADRGNAIRFGEPNDDILLVRAGEQISSNERTRIPEHLPALDARIVRESGMEQND